MTQTGKPSIAVSTINIGYLYTQITHMHLTYYSCYIYGEIEGIYTLSTLYLQNQLRDRSVIQLYSKPADKYLRIAKDGIPGATTSQSDHLSKYNMHDCMIVDNTCCALHRKLEYYCLYHSQL